MANRSLLHLHALESLGDKPLQTHPRVLNHPTQKVKVGRLYLVIRSDSCSHLATLYADNAHVGLADFGLLKENRTRHFDHQH